MKKKNLSSLILRKSRISNLNKLTNLIDITGCITNDKTKTLETPTLVMGCNGFQTGAGC